MRKKNSNSNKKIRVKINKKTKLIARRQSLHSKSLIAYQQSILKMPINLNKNLINKTSKFNKQLIKKMNLKLTFIKCEINFRIN